MSVLALNPFGARLGWYLGAAVGPVHFGTVKLAETTDPGLYFRSIDGALTQLLPRADGLVLRKPYVSGDAAFVAALKNVGMMGHILYQASFFPHLGAYTAVEMPTARLTLAGHGGADDDQLIAAARREGVEAEDEHQAGAYALWKVAIFGARQPRQRPRSSKGRSIMKEPSDDR